MAPSRPVGITKFEDQCRSCNRWKSRLDLFISGDQCLSPPLKNHSATILMIVYQRLTTSVTHENRFVTIQ